MCKTRFICFTCINVDVLELRYDAAESWLRHIEYPRFYMQEKFENFIETIL